MQLSIGGRLTGARFDTYKDLGPNHNSLYLLVDDAKWPYGYVCFTNIDPDLGLAITKLIEEANGRKPQTTPSNPGGPQPTQQRLRLIDDEIPF